MNRAEFAAKAAALWQRILRVDHASLFEGASPDIRDRDHGFDRLPQPGFVGSRYQLGGLLILGQNPGNDGIGKGVSPSDLLQYGYLETLRDAEGSEQALAAFNDLMAVLSSPQVMPDWKIIRIVVRPLLDRLKVNFDQVGYTNLVKFRTNDSDFKGALYEKSWQLTLQQIELLAPSVIVALGVGTYENLKKRYGGEAVVYKITRTRGDHFLPAAGLADIDEICAAESGRFTV